MEGNSLHEEGKRFADSLTDVVKNSGVSTQLDNTEDAFLSGCYFGAVQGYMRGVNRMLGDAVKYLPDIFNEISESGFDMKINWVERYKKLLLKNCFEIDEK